MYIEIRKIFNISKVIINYKSIYRGPYVFAFVKSTEFSRRVTNAMSPVLLIVLVLLITFSTYTQNASIVIFLFPFSSFHCTRKVLIFNFIVFVISKQLIILINSIHSNVNGICFHDFPSGIQLKPNKSLVKPFSKQPNNLFVFLLNWRC